MSLLKDTEVKIIKRVAILTLILIGIIFITISNPKPYVYGLVFGAIINVLNFRLMAITMAKSVHLPQGKIMPYVMGNYMIRYLIYGLVLTIAAMANYIDLLAVVIGFFMVKIVIISDTFYDMIKGKKNSDNRA